MVRHVALFMGGALLVVLGLRFTVWAEPKAGDLSPVAPPALEPGDAAPTFVLNDHDGKPVSVGGAAARWTVLSFFRRAGTPW